MDKVKFLIPRSKWGTLKSKYKPESNYVTPDEFTLGSYNFITNTDGTIEKRPTSVKYNPAAFTNVAKDQFEAIFTNGSHHLLVMDGSSLKYTTGDGIFSTAQTGFTASASMEYAMYQNRVYMDNSVDAPGVYDITASYGGVSYTPPQYKAMGAQPPGSAVTFAADSGTGLTGSFHYKVTFLYYGFEESNGGAASALHTVANKTINLTAVPIGGYGVTARKIYRDANDGNYLLVGTINDNTTTTFADATTAGTTPIPTSNNTPPVFSYIALNLSRLWVAGVSGTPTTLYWSNPGLPDIFDPNNFIVCNPKDPIQAIYVYQGIVIILNRHSIGQILGNTDDTFFYQEIPGSVGCVDNRSIQVRTIDGVPVLVWLSDRGIYSFNGSSVVYLSDAIEDEVNLNIAQVNFVTGSNTQTSAADWAAGTASPGIDLSSDPGTIETIDPTFQFESQADWETGTMTNIGTLLNGNMIKVPTGFSTSLGSGSLGGSAQISGSELVLPTIGNFTGQSNMGVPSSLPGSFGVSPTPISAFAQPISAPTYAGTITAVTIRVLFGGTTRNIQTTVWSDSLGQPGSILYQSGTHSISSDQTITESGLSVSISGGQKFWIGLTTSGSAGGEAFLDYAASSFSGGTPKILQSGSWVAPTSGISLSASLLQSNRVAYDFAQTAVASSGSWNSVVYDSKSNFAIPDFTVNGGSYPTSCSATLYVDASNDSSMSTGVVTQSFSNPNGINSVSGSLSNYRYWRLRYDIATSDNRRTPSVEVPQLRFQTTGTWISPAILTTIDGTSFISLPIVSNIPGGTSVAVTVRTSPNGSSWSAYSDISTAVIDKYAQIKIVLTALSDDSSTPSIVSAILNWNLTSTFTALAVNIGQVPSGWGLFQDVNGTSGTYAFSMRSAASSGALTSATYYTVSNGNFPNVSILPLQYTQWKVILSATPGNIPTVSSVTINWVIGNNQSPIRVASLFFNKTYYLAAAETGQTANNVVILYDFEGNWRLFRNVNINSLSLFFNQPFYCDAVLKFLYQWLIPSTGTSEVITMDVRTKAFDLLNNTNLKNVRSFRVTGINTGATIHAYYSVDRGANWYEMLNVQGSTGYLTSSDGNKFSVYFVPDYDQDVAFAGTTVMFRIVNSDAFPCNLMAMEPEMYVRKGKYIEEPV